jgi:intein/homing endonuclease
MSRKRSRVTSVKITRENGKSHTKHISYSNDCFAEGSMVLTCAGEREIETVQPGDQIWSLDCNRQILVRERVIKTLEYSSGKVLRFVCEGSREFRVTAYHSILTRSGWRKAGKLRVGDMVRFRSNAGKFIWCAVEAPAEPFGEQKVFNLITSGQHNYIVNGTVAHNFTFLRLLRVAFYRFLYHRGRKVALREA